jgi:hypothetical protein
MQCSRIVLYVWIWGTLKSKLSWSHNLCQGLQGNCHISQCKTKGLSNINLSNSFTCIRLYSWGLFVIKQKILIYCRFCKDRVIFKYLSRSLPDHFHFTLLSPKPHLSHLGSTYIEWWGKCMFSNFLTLFCCPLVYYLLISCRWKRGSGNLVAGKRGGVFPQSSNCYVACRTVHLVLRWRIDLNTVTHTTRKFLYTSP